MTGEASPTELVGSRTWAWVGALFLLIGGLLLIGGHGLALRLFALAVCAQGAKAMRVGVELQLGSEPEGSL